MKYKSEYLAPVNLLDKPEALPGILNRMAMGFGHQLQAAGELKTSHEKVKLPFGDEWGDKFTMELDTDESARKIYRVIQNLLPPCYQGPDGFKNLLIVANEKV